MSKKDREQKSRKNLPKQAGTLIASVDNDITINNFSDILTPQDATLIEKDGGKGLALYDEIERDGRAWAVLQKRKKVLLASEWQVNPASEKPVDVEVSDFTEEQLQRLPFDQICEDLLDATLKGFAISEIIWGRDGGYFVPKEIKAHDQRRFVFDKKWQPRLLTLNNMMEGSKLPDRKFIIHRHGVKGNNPYGLGLGSKLFWPVLFKREGVAFWLHFLDKFAGPTVIGKTPYGMEPAEEARLLNILSMIKTSGAVAVPIGTELDLLEAARTGSVTYEEWNKYWDKEITITTLGETLTTDIGDVGSKAAASTHSDILELLVDADADLLSTTLKTSLTKWLVELNFAGASAPDIWRVRQANELELAQTRKGKAKASAEETRAVKEVMAMASKIEDDEEARTFITVHLPREDYEDDYINCLIVNRHGFAVQPAQVGMPEEEEEQGNQPKKKVSSRDGNVLKVEFSEKPEQGDNVQLLTDDALMAAQPFFEKRLADIRQAIENSSSFEEAEKALLELRASWKLETFGEIMASTLRLAGLYGHDAVQREVDGETDTDSFAEPQAIGQPFAEQIAFFEQKDRRPSRRWYDLVLPPYN